MTICMTIRMEGEVAHLQGDLTYSGMTQNILNSLDVSLQQIESGGKKNICIDCGGIRKADINGLQLLYVWMQCASFSGVASKLFNLPVNLQQTLKRMGLEHCFPVWERTFFGRNVPNLLAG